MVCCLYSSSTVTKQGLAPESMTEFERKGGQQPKLSLLVQTQQFAPIVAARRKQ